MLKVQWDTIRLSFPLYKLRGFYSSSTPKEIEGIYAEEGISMKMQKDLIGLMV